MGVGLSRVCLTLAKSNVLKWPMDDWNDFRSFWMEVIQGETSSALHIGPLLPGCGVGQAGSVCGLLRIGVACG